MSNFVGIRSKVYAYRTNVDYDNQKEVLENHVQEKLILNSIITVYMMVNLQKKISQNKLRSNDHDIYMQKVTKKLLFLFDDKENISKILKVFSIDIVNIVIDYVDDAKVYNMFHSYVPIIVLLLVFITFFFQIFTLL